MTLVLDVSPDTQQALARQAEKLGEDLPSYVTRLLNEAVLYPADDAGKSIREKSFLEIFEPIRGLDMEFEADRRPSREIDL